MSGDTAVISPRPQPASSLAPPSLISRPSSTSSARSASSGKARSKGSSASISRSNSASSQGPKTKNSGTTTTISGGTRLGNNKVENGSKGKLGKNNVVPKDIKTADLKGPIPAEGKKKQDSRRASTVTHRPKPINTTALVRSTSQTSTTKSIGSDNAATTQSAPAQPRSIHTVPSVPKTAMEAAMDAATQKHGGDALSSLQKMISDLKGITPPALSSSSSGSRAVSAKEPPAKAPQPATSPAPIPSSATSKKLKADAPSFTPSFQPSLSPAVSTQSISPGTVQPPPWPAQQSSSASRGSQDRRTSSSSAHGNGGFTSLSGMSGLATSPAGMYATPLPHFPLGSMNQFQYHLASHPEAENENLSSLLSFPQNTDMQYQQQLANAQQLQYQQIQVLQAQIAANQLAQQQAALQQQQQQNQMGSFIAPRFQALAAQRSAAQQQQQMQQLAQAQQIYELQQQQLQDYQRQQEDAKRIAEAALLNPPPVFEEDSPESKPNLISPAGRPQLAPSFTFGAKKRQDSVDERQSISPPQYPPVINRSEGIGGAQSTGLAGLAARAHKRTGSELTPGMQQQLDIQKEIEMLQAKQKALMVEDLASTGGNALSQLSSALGHKSTPSQTLARHRRVQSSISGATSSDFYGPSEVLDTVERPPARVPGEMPSPSVPAAGHSRRHSVNAPKPAGSGAGFNYVSDIPEDGMPNIPGHYRSGSNRSAFEDGMPNGSIHFRSGSRSGFESGNWRSMAQGPPAVADLAAAQAQLQSLAQFRAAGGGGHSKMASFSFPNMLPNLLAATTLSTPAGQSLWQQQQAFQMQLQQTAQGPQRKSLFAPYLPQASLPPLLQAGKLVVGFLRVNKKNRSDAYVATDVLEADIYICGSKDRNRALEGDIVAVELLDVDEVWSTKKSKEEKKRKKEENAAYDFNPAQTKNLEKKKDDVEVEGQGLTLFDDEEVNDDTKPMYAGHVVAVVERMPGQLFSGQLGVLRPSSAATKEKQELERRDREGDRAKKEEPEARPKIVWFKPTDKRVPLIAIPTEQAPIDFIDNPDTYADRLFVATIKRWPITSLHPFGTLVEELGPIGDIEVETKALLKDCNFPTEEFQELTMKCLPPLPWSIPEREYVTRTDLRKERIFTIDPQSAKDLDDALSIKQNDDETFTVGVHIADVSYFVKANTAMDRDARKRATSVYLVQRSLPMLPPQLSEQLCSLQPGLERLAFSAFLTLDKDANVMDRRFERTIIKSCGQLSYDDAQTVIKGGSLSDKKLGAEHLPSAIEGDIKALHDLASNLRAKRLDAGAMTSTKIKVCFELDEGGAPVDCDADRRTEANTLVEEFMLLANTSVARIIANGLPEQSLLRRHEAPLERRIEGFVKRAAKLGYTFDSTNAGTLQKGFDLVQDREVALCLDLLKRKAMQRARYFCAGMLDIAKYSHWSLSTPLYTHFTSPIRRYADILVHRMLEACLSSPNPNDVKFFMDRDQVAKCAQQCNMKKQSAKLAEEQSVHLHLCMLIHDLTERYGPVIREGRVTGVLDAAFDIVIPEFGIEKRVHIDKMPVDNTVFDEHQDILSLYWTSQDVLSFVAETTDEPHLMKIKALGIGNFKSLSDDSLAVISRQSQKSAYRSPLQFDGLRSTPGGHKVQDIKELMALPVIVMSDITKSPPVLVVYACNPYAA